MYDMANSKASSTRTNDGGAGGSMYDMANSKASNTSVYDMGDNTHTGEALYAEASNDDGYLAVGPDVEEESRATDATYDFAGNSTGGNTGMVDTTGGLRALSFVVKMAW